MFTLLEKYLMKPMSKVSNLRVVRAVTAAGMASISFSIVGSMFLVLNILPDTMPFLRPFFEATIFKFSSLYMLAYTASMGMIGVYFLVTMSYEYANIIKTEDKLNINPVNATLLAVFSVLMLIPQLVVKDGVVGLLHNPEAGIINGWAIGDGISRLAASGLFTVIIMSVISVRIYAFCVKRNIVIKLPDTVPDGVARSFTALIPAFFVALFVLVVNGILVYLGTDVYALIAIPFGFVSNLTNSWIGLMVIYFLIHALWLVGIHGATIISAIIQPIVLANLASNAAGQTAIPLAGDFTNSFVTTGGSGATLGLIIMMCIITKSDQLKYLGRASIVPAIFNINEPILFGLPLVYNPFMAIPFFLAPMSAASLAYFALKLGFVSPIVVNHPWPTPVGISGLLATGGDVRAFILSVLCALLAAAIYFPFLKYYDNKLYKEEQMKSQEA